MILAIFACLILVGLDALSNCFGLVNNLSESYLTNSACAHACNQEEYQQHLIDGTNQTYRFSESLITTYSSYETGPFPTIPRTLASCLNAVAAPFSFLIAKLSGIYNNKNTAKTSQETKTNTPLQQKKY